MNFIDNTLTILRHLIDDTDECSYEYTDERLSALIYVSSIYVNTDISGGYTIGPFAQTISPEPADSFIGLTALKAACLLARSVYKSYSRNDFKVIDGPTTIDLGGATKELGLVSKDFCNEYSRNLNRYLVGGGPDGGVAVSTPNSNS